MLTPEVKSKINTQIQSRREDSSFVPQVQIDGDKALEVVGIEASDAPIDADTNRKLVRKIDRCLMPVGLTSFKAIAIGLLMSGVRCSVSFTALITLTMFASKETALSYASITGMPQDLHLVKDNYEWLGSLFYIGYLGFEFIAIRLLQYFPLAKYSACCIILWGIVLTLFAVVNNFAGAAAIRLLLGMFEASVSPGWTLFTSQWYQKEEQGIRVAWWVSFNGWAQIFGGVVAYGFAQGGDEHGYSIAPWKALYIFLGLLTIVLGVVFLFVIPDNQLNAWWLTKEERIQAIERVRINQSGIGNRHFKWYQFRESLLDPAVWAIYLIALVGLIPNGGITNFFNILIKSFGYSTDESLLYGCFLGVVEIGALLGWAYASRYLGYRLLTSSIGMLVALLGSLLLVFLPQSAIHGRLAGLFLTQFFLTGLICVVSIIASNVGGYTKKTVVAGGFFLFYSAGNIIGPQTFRPKDAPLYRPAETILIVCYAFCFADLVFLHCWYHAQNKKKVAAAAAAASGGIDGAPATSLAFLDLTDRENPDFRYSL